ncbi:zinc finger matrin-type protein 3 isoform X2 [Amia ocellicauda]|uniref:zinc finger matrin-type protein 3 isoform X2 n=1 Tax=Amia ocellicauda TaxID=2972642 RepID=UPI003464D3D4
MAMNVKNRTAYYQNNDYCKNYIPQSLNYNNNNQFFHRLPGPDATLKPPLSAVCPLPPPPFQPLLPCQALRPQGAAAEALRFPLSTTLSTKPPSLQTAQRPPLPTPPPAGPQPLSLQPLPQPPQDEEPPAGGEPECTLEELCKPLYCKLCNVTLNSAQQAQAHYQGKNHSKKLRNFYAGSQQPPPIRVPEVVEPVTQQPPTPPTETATACKQALPFKTTSRVILATENDYCKLCDASFSSPAVAQAHYQGKNHAKRLRMAEAHQSSLFLDSSEPNQRRLRKEGSEFKSLKSRRNTHVPISVPVVTGLVGTYGGRRSSSDARRSDEGRRGQEQVLRS